MKKGILGRKLGMTQVFTESGKLIPVTVVEVEPNVVTQIKTKENDGYEAIQLGFDTKREKLATKASVGGAHSSGLIGESPKGKPNNLMPFISKVAKGELDCLKVFGNDYNTPDGTGVRDYIHVVDLAIGHIKAIEKLNKENKGLYIYNLGTGTGYSVLEMINAFEKVNNVTVKYEITDRREGDIATCYSDPSKSEKELGFKTTHTLEDMCRDSWNFEKNYRE